MPRVSPNRAANRRLKSALKTLGFSVLVGFLCYEWGSYRADIGVRGQVRNILDRGESELKDGRFDEAERLCERALELLTDNKRLYARSQSLAGRVHYSRGTKEVTDAG